jgi:hypothetical protein
LAIEEHKVTDVLAETGLPTTMMRAQGYDGASNLSGNKSGLSTRLQQIQRTAVHCYEHKLNLSLQDTCKSITDIRNVLGTVSSVYNLLEGSAERHEKFKDVQEENRVVVRKRQYRFKGLAKLDGDQIMPQCML